MLKSLYFQRIFDAVYYGQYRFLMYYDPAVVYLSHDRNPDPTDKIRGRDHRKEEYT